MCQLVHVLLVIIITLSSASWLHNKNHPQTNLLYIMHDDLRPELSVYGRNHMITPNYQRLAGKSVVFDNAYVQIAVCNPSRDSILTGLRPDTVGTYGFQHSWGPHMLFPQQLVKSGYDTAAYGKLLHWDGDYKDVWSKESWQGNWYEYQNLEWSFMNASVQPDAVRKEEEFRDHIMTTKAVKGLKRFAKDNIPTDPSVNQTKFFMLAIGFKLPHITLHVPHKYYKMYEGIQMPNISAKELTYPLTTSPACGYRCCGEDPVRYVNDEGRKKSSQSADISAINAAVPYRAHNEIMSGYSAGISFLDTQLGRILDTLDELKLWDKITIVLSSDHGMHNGEKGTW